MWGVQFLQWMRRRVEETACGRGLFMWPQWISHVSPVLSQCVAPIMEFPPVAVMGSYLTCEIWIITNEGNPTSTKNEMQFLIK